MSEKDPLLTTPPPMQPPMYPPVDAQAPPPMYPPVYSVASAQPPPIQQSSLPFSPQGNAFPPANEHPNVEVSSGWSGWKDRGFAIAFWIHFIIVVILGFALGVPAIRSDAKKSYDDPTRTVYDFNADLFIRVFVGAAALSGLVAFIAFFILQRCAGRIIKCALYMGIVFQILLCISLFIVAWPMGLIGLVFLVFSIWYVYYVRNRIAFAEAHIQVGCEALRSHPSILLVALAMLVLQFLWILMWSMMMLGLEHRINGPETNSSSGSFGGVIAAIILLTSLFWGALVFRNITHFVAACVVGQWWFVADAHRQYAVETSVRRAFTTNFGTISFGSFILAFIKALRVIAQIQESNARRDGNIVLLLLSCMAVCILRVFESLVRYLTEWAFVFSALTGQSFRSASQSFLDLFRQRGWTLVINDDLANSALTIVTLAIGLFSAAVGGISTYLVMPHSSSRAPIAGMVAFFCFTIGITMGTILTSILSAGVRAAFVCFAMNPAALGSTHPEHLERLLLAWYEFHPQEFAASGFAMYMPKPAGGFSTV